MTAYARQQIHTKVGDILWELKTLNSRYLEIHLKLNEEWRSIEPDVRSSVSSRLNRGKVECQFRFKRNDETSSELILNETLCNTLIETADQVANKSDKLVAFSVSDILRWPGMVSEPEQNMSEISPQAIQCLEKALDELVETREREGERIKAMIVERCEQMTELVSQVRARIPDVREGLEQKLKQKLADIDINVDPNRFEQELVFHLQRLDVAEEIDRLQSHIDEVKKVLDREDSVGRRLDFLMQELNREANTLGSKVSHMDIKGISVELKVLIEQMREQIQNIE